MFQITQSFVGGLSESEHKAEMRDIYEHKDTQSVLVAETNDEKVVGFLEVGIRPFVEDCYTDHVGYLEGSFVESAFQRCGIGSKMIRDAEAWARSKGCRKMASDAEIGIDLSIKAHQTLGYVETSRLVHLQKNLV